MEHRLSLSAPVSELRLSTGSAALIAGCYPVTVWRAIDRGELRAIRLGEHGHYRIARRDLQTWLRPRSSMKHEAATSSDEKPRSCGAFLLPGLDSNQ